MSRLFHLCRHACGTGAQGCLHSGGPPRTYGCRLTVCWALQTSYRTWGSSRQALVLCNTVPVYTRWCPTPIRCPTCGDPVGRWTGRGSRQLDLCGMTGRLGVLETSPTWCPYQGRHPLAGTGTRYQYPVTKCKCKDGTVTLSCTGIVWAPLGQQFAHATQLDTCGSGYGTVGTPIRMTKLRPQSGDRVCFITIRLYTVRSQAAIDQGRPWRCGLCCDKLCRVAVSLSPK